MTNPSDTRDSELVAKLRKWADWLDFDIGTDQPAGKDLREAADTIDRLTSSGEAETEDSWRDLALQFDGHRIEALSMLRYVSEAANQYEAMGRIGEIKAFLAKPPLSGEAVLAARLAASPREGHVEVPVEPGLVRNDSAGFYEFVAADIPTFSKPFEARNVEALHDMFGSRGLVGFRVWDAANQGETK
jgi:hypothetical protein